MGSSSCLRLAGLVATLAAASPSGAASSPAGRGPAPRSDDSEADRWFVLEQHVETAREATYLAAKLAADPTAKPELIALGNTPTLPARREGTFRVAATHHGNRWAYAS